MIDYISRLKVKKFSNGVKVYIPTDLYNEVINLPDNYKTANELEKVIGNINKLIEEVKNILNDDTDKN